MDPIFIYRSDLIDEGLYEATIVRTSRINPPFQITITSRSRQAREEAINDAIRFLQDRYQLQ